LLFAQLRAQRLALQLARAQRAVSCDALPRSTGDVFRHGWLLSTSRGLPCIHGAKDALRSAEPAHGFNGLVREYLQTAVVAAVVKAPRLMPPNEKLGDENRGALRVDRGRVKVAKQFRRHASPRAFASNGS